MALHGLQQYTGKRKQRILQATINHIPEAFQKYKLHNMHVTSRSCTAYYMSIV